MIRVVPAVAPLLVVMTFVVALPACAQESSARAQFDVIVQSLSSGRVASIEVFGVPSDAAFIVNVTPEHLEEMWDFKLTLRGPSGLGPRSTALTKALNSASIRSVNEKLEYLDFRWGVGFYSKTLGDKRIGTLYFEGTGHLGAVNNVPISFGPDFLVQLKKALRFPIE